MIGSPLLPLLVAAAALCAGCQSVGHHNISTDTNKTDQVEVYRKFLDGLTTGMKKERINVSMTAQEPPPESMKEISDCLRKDGSTPPRWLPAKSVDDLGDTIGELPYVHLVDAKKWKLHDPEDLMAQGQSTQSAINDGYAHGILRMSAIAFDESHQTAALTFSFVCGKLCGAGAAVIFKKTQSGWVQSEKDCAGWVS